MSTSARTIDHTGAYGAPWLSADQMNLVLAPPMSRQTVLRVMVLGFGLAVLLVIGAAYIGYQASESIQRNAQDLIREHLLNSERGAALEARIERQSQELLGELI